mmetsp:Transcript_19293/g.68168  ORF Transcript_19293/g.68168 Transcript_19293/m.68168 type:complete len:218 (+) Transcript_19293:483-1136(+)
MRVLPTASEPSATPGKMYALLPCPGTCVLPLYSTASNGEPLMKIPRPSVHSYACLAVHSALLVGFDSAHTTGTSLNDAKSRMTLSVKAPACADTPTRMDGFVASTQPCRSATSGTSCAYSSLWCCSPSRRLSVTRPRESTRKIFLRASSMVSPSISHVAANATSSAMPTPASPAPRNRMVWSCSFFLSVSATACSRPASTTDAVPWMSSLNTQCVGW